MNVPGEFQQAYNQIVPALEKLKVQSNRLLQGVAHSVGGRLIEARIKPIESVLLKTEKDGLAKPFDEMTDLLAATIVVKNEGTILRVEEEVRKIASVFEPVSPKVGKPEEFIYDDRHVILKLIQDPGNADPELENLSLELQIKTEMRAAASSITRDLDYKSRWLVWQRKRWASRIRALVEMVDDLLVKLAEEESESDIPPTELYPSFEHRNRILRTLLECLVTDQLPEDRRRLAVTVERYLRDCNPPLPVADLRTFLLDARHTTIREASSLSPAQKVFLELFREGKLLQNAGDPSSLLGSRRYLITKEMIDLCPELRAVPQNRRIDLSLKG